MAKIEKIVLKLAAVKPKLAFAMRLSLITALYNKLEYSKAFIESLEAHSGEAAFELILVDNASTDGTTEWLNSLEGKYTIIRNNKNRGFAAANNQAARQAKGEILGFLNNDLILRPSWLAPMLAVFEAEKRVGVVGNVQLNARTGRVDHAGMVFNREGVGMHYGRGYPRCILAERKQFYAVTAACCLVRRNVFLDAGGFDEAFVNGFEDVDFCLRLGEKGYRHFVAGRSVVRHHIGSSQGRFDREDANRRLFLKRWGTFTRRQGARDWAKNYLLQHTLNPWRLNARKAWDAFLRLARVRGRREVSRLGILITGTLGDALISIPIIHYLRSGLSQVDIYLLYEQQGARPSAKDVLFPLGLAQKFHALKSDPQTGKMGLLGLWYGGLLARIFHIRQLCLITSATRSAKSLRVMRWVLRDTLIGLLTGFDPLKKENCLPRDDAGCALEGSSELYWRMHRLGIRENPAQLLERFPLVIHEAIHRDLDQWMEAQGVNAQTPRIAVAPCSGMPSKDWDWDRWHTLIAQVLERFPKHHIALLGGTTDANTLESLALDYPRVENFAGKIEFMESVALVQRAVGFIGLDSALSHAAAMLGTPAIVIFSGQSHPGLWRPLARDPRKLHVLTHETRCQGCLERVCPYNEHPCMQSIQVQTVFEAFVQMIEKHS